MSQQALGVWAAAKDAPDTDEAPVWQGSLSWLAFQYRLDREAIEAAERGPVDNASDDAA